MAFPSDEELKRIRKLLKNVEGTRIVGEEGTKIEKFKFSLCQNMLGFYKDSGMSKIEFAILLGIDQAIVSKILKCRIEVFTLDRLLKYYEILFPDYKIVIGS
ncbi:MAG: hypothetical protein H7281_16270 [Bacteriovorax sp.]|nr:hypothetical protein [Bacteriovorax sp.]